MQLYIYYISGLSIISSVLMVISYVMAGYLEFVRKIIECVDSER